MDLKYSVNPVNMGNDSKQASFHSQQGVCVVSQENIVVFTRVLYHSNSFKQSIPVYTVYIADLNCPFETHVIMESLDQIVKAAFNSSGHQILIVTSLGYVRIYTKGSGLHQWTNTHTENWSEGEILYVDFFHTKNKPSIQITDIKVNALYSEKFQCRAHQPSLKTIGNCPQNGFFAIAASGIIFACTLNSNGVLEEEGKAVLGPVRDNFSLATAAFSPSGHIHIAAWKPEIVKCWEVELRYIERERIASKDGTIFGGISIGGNRKLQINVQSAQPLSLSTYLGEGNRSNCHQSRNTPQGIKVSHIKYTDQEDPNNLLIYMEVDKEKYQNAKEKVEQPSQQGATIKNEAEKGQSVYLLLRYQLVEKNRAIFKFFPQSSSIDNSNSTTVTKEWVCQGEWLSNHRLLSLSTSSRHLFPGSSIPFIIVVASSDGNVYSINKDTMQQMSKYSFHSLRSDEMPPLKRLNNEKQIICLSITWTSLHIVALDSVGGLHLLSLLKQSDLGSTWPVYIMLLLEYSLVSGHDWWDILMAAPPTSALTLADRLTETFHQHPSQVVSNLMSKFLVLKNSVLRLSSNLHQRSMEARLQAQLSAILKLFQSLRPVTSDIVSVEKNFAANIQAYVESRTSLEIPDLDKSIDNLLFSCNILDCQIDPALGQDLQILLQLSTDLALYLLLLLVQNPKYELAKEPKTLLYLREILFTSRIWYRHSKLVVPQMIKKTDSVDIWAQLYKLLTRLAHILPNEPDTVFLDDCVVLETQVVCREIPLFIPPRGVVGCISSSPLSTPSYPLQFTYDQFDPNPTASNVNPRPLEGSLAPPQPLDPLYYHYLGANGPLLQCTRCFAVRGSWWGNNDLSVWDQEWYNRCICSGHWAPALNKGSPKTSYCSQSSRINFACAGS